MTVTRPDAQALDAADPLAAFGSRYLPQPDDVVAYLDGNSLGRPLASIAEVWTDFAHQQWAGRLIRGWTEGWMDLPEKVGDELGAAALGAAPGQTVIADSTTVNFYKAVRAAINLRPGRRKIVIDRDNFPTNRYVVESLAKDHGLEIVWLIGTDVGGIGPDDLAAVLDEDVAVLTMSHIAYHSGYLADMAAVTAAAHAVGALVVWDLCHSVGSVPISLDACDVDLAVGCTYKFVGAGPGAPAFSYVNARHHDRLDQPIWGWLGRQDSFEMEQGYVPAAGIRSMISGTPSVLGILAVREGAAVIAEAGIDAIRAKIVGLGEMVIDLFDEHLQPLGFRLASPRDPIRRGGHVSIARSDARELCSRLTAAGVLPDFRTPDAIRIGLSPLPLRFTEVWDGVSVIRDLSA
ncbi:Kynureninase [Nakamurella panacisegetis]|uniref:Kynureninase n=1 Tax=Nakamurella panacisegetis TaxID=1090615 RepID=A0A1H0MSS0_9ACTN|nr:aminotransferase class V-fold PLP-dependent enzyme [Nakamurella panacisegetis]SDO83180.1 Kynureninase [Nakamurella panacisegetis]